MISFVAWKWRGSNDRPAFESHHVNVLAASIARHYRPAHRFICITDDPRGLDPAIVPVVMPNTQTEHLQNPSEAAHYRRIMQLRDPHRHASKSFPSCYRRLWNFSREAAEVLGDRIFALDVDVVVTGDLVPLVQSSASFVGWCDRRFKWNKVAGAAYLLRTGHHHDVWEDFDPSNSPAVAHAAGNGGSDQGWLSHKLWPPPAHWSSVDGLLKFKWLTRQDAAPAGSRLIFSNGDVPPWSDELQRLHPWIKRYWRL